MMEFIICIFLLFFISWCMPEMRPFKKDEEDEVEKTNLHVEIDLDFTEYYNTTCFGPTAEEIRREAIKTRSYVERHKTLGVKK